MRLFGSPDSDALTVVYGGRAFTWPSFLVTLETDTSWLFDPIDSGKWRICLNSLDKRLRRVNYPYDRKAIERSASVGLARAFASGWMATVQGRSFHAMALNEDHADVGSDRCSARALDLFIVSEEWSRDLGPGIEARSSCPRIVPPDRLTLWTCDRICWCCHRLIGNPIRSSW